MLTKNANEISCGTHRPVKRRAPRPQLLPVHLRTGDIVEPVKATAVSTVVYGVFSCWMYLLGMGAAIITGESDIAAILLKAGLGIA